MRSLPFMAGLVLTFVVGCDVSRLDRVRQPDAPEAPVGLAVITVTPSSLEWAWQASASATQYELVRDADLNGDDTTPVYAGAEHFAIDRGLRAASTWYYRVRGVSSVGPGPWSDPVAGTTAGAQDTTAPSPIDDLLVRTGDMQGELTATWTNPGDADFAGVAFRYRTDGVFPASLDDGLPLATATTAVSSTRWGELDPGLPHYISGFAFDTTANYAPGAEAMGPARPRVATGETIRREASYRDFEQGAVVDTRIVRQANTLILMGHPGSLQPPVELELGADVGWGAVMPHVVRTSAGLYRMYFAYESGGVTKLGVKESQDGLTSWSATQDLGIGSAQAPATEPFAYPLSGNRVRLFYTEGGGSFFDARSRLMFSDSSDGVSAWSTPQPVELGLGNSAGAFVHDAIDTSARLYFASFTDRSWDLHVAISSDGLETWSQVRALDAADATKNRAWPLLVPLRSGDFSLFAAGRRVDRPTAEVGISHRRTPDGLTNFDNAIGGGFMNDIRGFCLVPLDDGSFRYYLGEWMSQSLRTVYRAASPRFTGYGTYESRVFGGFDDDPDYQDISWVADTPAGTKVSLQLRSGTTRTNLGLWRGPREGVNAYVRSPAVPSDEHDGDRYMQYRVILETTDERVSPVVHEVSIGLTLR